MLSRLSALRAPRRAELPALLRRLAHFWIVWSLLLLVHEAGHAASAWRQGRSVHRITVGVGPVLWRTTLAGEGDGQAQLVLRLIPLAGVTALADLDGEVDGWAGWRRDVVTLGGGVLATLVLGLGIAAVVAARERGNGTRWVWGRMLVADALVLTVFNFLPVPPLDGGRAVVEAVAAWRGAPLAGDALMWVHVGGLALAVVPMTLWTRWTRRIDTFAMLWGAPPERR